MKPIRIFTLILAAVVLFSGCDRIRSMMGKPTSSDLERLRVEKEAQEKALRDSIARAEEALAVDSVAAATPEKPVAAKPVVTKPTVEKPTVVSSSTGNLPRYSVVVGSYVKEYNVRAMTRRMEKRGETVTVIPFKSGFTGVAVFTTNDFAEARAKRKEMLASGAVPSDTWIYDTTWGRHK